jgi:hypothetical protein
MPNLASKIIMWLAWWFAVTVAIMEAHYLIAPTPRLNSFSKPFGVFAIGMFFIPILFCGGLRFWLSRIRNPWLALVPFFGGVFFAWMAEMFGIFLFPEFCIAFQILSAVLFLVYLPFLVRPERIPPPIPASEA